MGRRVLQANGGVGDSGGLGMSGICCTLGKARIRAECRLLMHRLILYLLHLLQLGLQHQGLRLPPTLFQLSVQLPGALFSLSKCCLPLHQRLRGTKCKPACCGQKHPSENKQLLFGDVQAGRRHSS